MRPEILYQLWQAAETVERLRVVNGDVEIRLKSEWHRPTGNAEAWVWELSEDRLVLREIAVAAMERDRVVERGDSPVRGVRRSQWRRSVSSARHPSWR